MGEKVEVKPESLLNLDDLLQCPVCYEIPTGQIFQCNEGHHVCGRCKVRLDVCPVCRALFFGTRNYAMEELIANFRKLRAFKTGGKVSAESGSSDSSTTNKDATSEEPENETGDEENANNNADQQEPRAPPACKGLFRCLCCKNGNAERLPSARLLNHLRYFHGPDLIEGRSENGEYLQAWQFSTAPGRLVTAVRVADMGVFFLVIEINNDSIHAWLMMAASPWVAHAFNYTVTMSGNDREAIFSDCVSSVRSCEGSLKKRGHCLVVTGMDARALIAPSAVSGKLSIRHTPPEQLATLSQPRTVMRVANRGVMRDPPRAALGHQLEPFLQDLQNDVARLSRAFATLGREANALVRSEAEIRARIEGGNRGNRTSSTGDSEDFDAPVQVATNQSAPVISQPTNPELPMSRNARRRMRQRLRAALNEPQTPVEVTPVAAAPRVQTQAQPANTLRQNGVLHIGYLDVHEPEADSPAAQPQSSSGTSNGRPVNGLNTRTNKKKRRQHR